MKPTKNQIFCIGCKHKKMLFESKSKADNFIKFNGEEIENQSGKAPTRSYYCSFCGGWHVTSIAEEDKGIDRDKRDEQLWERISEINSKKGGAGKKQSLAVQDTDTIIKRSKFPSDEKGFQLKTIALKIDRVLQDVTMALCSVDVTRICIRFEELKGLETEAKLKCQEYKLDIKALNKRFDKIEAVRNKFLYIYDFIVDDEKRKNYLEKLGENDRKTENNIIISNIEIIKTINKILDEIDISNEDIDQRNNYKRDCKKIVTELIPQLKGNTKPLQELLKYKIKQIVCYL